MISENDANYLINTQTTSSNPPAVPKKREQKKVPTSRFKWTGFADKTLWDWLNLVAILLVPIIIGVATLQVSVSTLQFTNQQNKTALDMTRDQQREAVLTHYMDDISNLLIDKDLRNAQKESPVQRVAIMKTASLQRRLDTRRNNELLHFIQDEDLLTWSSHTIEKETHKGVISLAKANLSYTDLGNTDLSYKDLNHVDLSYANLNSVTWRDTDLSYANLNHANLMHAELFGADLPGTNLKNVDLSYADLFFTDLSQADLSQANITPKQLAQAKSLKDTILPDGSKYPSTSWPIPNGPKG